MLKEGKSRPGFDIITGDESWFYHYDPKTKEQSKVWISKTDSRPAKVHRNTCAEKRMVVIFFVKSGLLKSVPLEAGGSLTASWYVNICLPQVFEAVSEQRQTRGLRIHQILVFVTSFCIQNSKTNCVDFDLTTIIRCSMP
jgi:hypothetical protein